MSIKKVNEHAKLTFRGILKEGEEKTVTLKEEGKTLFCGVAASIGVVCESGVFYLEAEAVSWTVKLDEEKKKRSFQENGLSYHDIAKQLAKEADGKVKCHAQEKKVENLLLEYRETDWVKYLRTPNGKEIKLDREEILITANDDVTYIKINEASGVEIITDKAVQVTSGGSVTVNSGDQISMTSTNDFSINAGKNLSITAADSITMTCQENSMKFETPSTGIEMSASKPIKVTGGDTIDVNSTGKFTAKSSNELQVVADQKLETESKQTLEIKCKDNEVKLENGGKGIDISSGKAISIEGKNIMDIKSTQAMNVSSSQNVDVSAGQNLSLSASSELAEECKGSSIKLNGDIDMKAKLIKEN